MNNDLSYITISNNLFVYNNDFSNIDFSLSVFSHFDDLSSILNNFTYTDNYFDNSDISFVLTICGYDTPFSIDDLSSDKLNFLNTDSCLNRITTEDDIIKSKTPVSPVIKKNHHTILFSWTSGFVSSLSCCKIGPLVKNSDNM